MTWKVTNDVDEADDVEVTFEVEGANEIEDVLLLWV